MQETGERQKQVPEVIDSFRKVLEEVAATPGKREELTNSANDTFGGFMQTFSMQTPIIDEVKIKEGLRMFIAENVPEGESQATLEAGFETEGTRVKEEGHYVYRMEWDLIRADVAIGVEALRDDRGESVRTWYIRNTQKKPGLLQKLFKKSG